MLSIGFDVRGDVKIFDFGLAKELDPDKSEDGLYKLTGDTGSPRYMAPGKLSSQKSDVTAEAADPSTGKPSLIPSPMFSTRGGAQSALQ